MQGALHSTVSFLDSHRSLPVRRRCIVHESLICLNCHLCGRVEDPNVMRRFKALDPERNSFWHRAAQWVTRKPHICISESSATLRFEIYFIPNDPS